jgi:hypothetical protein
MRYILYLIVLFYGPVVVIGVFQLLCEYIRRRRVR